MHVVRLVTGNIEENCYLIWQNHSLLIIDPGADAMAIWQKIEQIGVTPIAILLTHTHYDHIGAVDDLRDKYQIPVYVNPLEIDWLQHPTFNLSDRFPKEKQVVIRPAEYKLELREYTLGDISFKVVPTPGHSIGSVSFIFNDFVVSGDALFKGSIGRPDLYTGDLTQLLDSIKSQLFILPEQFDVYPGHGQTTTIGYEKTTNPFFD
ncbi:MBL fold metallo-hydrolase [Tetragenococcus osmophilus]|uniref:Hydroxyacylglutathione hydrolase n=1 Tax=Tetragenococcus osmophilus TaxID=526944 RepID=A0AA37XKH0_9ENTE|nr:MBL fold metallo-hydrolase [Tetragenococcus osmophilus]AYW48630.1 MBL fold metallo-hydrolase [Tetragenococcus osmophilus]GMA54557.1 hydroxyacylglutathione hydrolase [Alicyclobacillus contaminans]GMA71599.1 hydroxyacylglutathione hydrolase [Tetragenococcus osmophilus]